MNLKGPYTNAVLRFQIAFPDDYPDRPPVVTFLQDVFHPLVTPLTTYTHSTRERGGTISAADEEKLPPGGLVLKEGFPEWFENKNTEAAKRQETEPAASEGADTPTATHDAPPHIAQVLQYVRLVFSAPEIIDGVPLSSAANPSAWHAWRSHRAKVLGENRAQSPAKSLSGDASSEGSLSPRAAQPGGARRPGEWNWSGVWEDRVRKVIAASRAEGTLFGGGEAGDVVSSSMFMDTGFCRPQGDHFADRVIRSPSPKSMTRLWLAFYHRSRRRWLVDGFLGGHMRIARFINPIQMLCYPEFLPTNNDRRLKHILDSSALEATYKVVSFLMCKSLEQTSGEASTLKTSCPYTNNFHSNKISVVLT